MQVFVLPFCCSGLFIGFTQAAEDYPERARDATIVETLLRLNGYDLESSAKGKVAALRFVEHDAGNKRAFELVEKYPLEDFAPLLLKLAIEKPNDTAGVSAARWLLKHQHDKLIANSLEGEEEKAASLATAIGHAGEPRIVDVLFPLVSAGDTAAALRSAAVRAVGRFPDGRKKLLQLVVDGKLPESATFATTNVLHAAQEPEIRAKAKQLLSLPATANAKPLPPLDQLIKRRGNVAHGKQIFVKAGTCANCHKVTGDGKEVGPDLSEIGSKLSREAMFIAILDPNAGISHNYESYLAVLDSGTTFTGIKISETDESVTLKSDEAIVREISKDEIEELIKQKISLMPADLQKNMTAEHLVDLVEYLMTLKKADATPKPE